MSNKLWIIISLLSLSTIATHVYLDPISTAAPPFQVITHTFKPLLPVTQTGPIQTNKFWGNLLASMINDPVHAHPYVLRLQKQDPPFGVGFSSDFATKVLGTSPDRADMEKDGQQEFYVNVLNNDFIATSVEYNNDTLKSIVYHDIFGCHLQLGVGGKRMLFPIFRGMAYVTIVYENMTPSLFTVSFFQNVNGLMNTVVTGNKFKILLGNGQNWILYSDKTISLSVAGNNIKANSVFNGVLKLARLPVNQSSASESIYDTYSSSYIVGGSLDLETTSNQSVSSYIFNWKTNGTGQLLHFALPHHLDTMVVGTKTSLQLWSTVKGIMTAFVGSTWKNTEKGLWTDVSFLPKNSPDSNRISDIKNQIIKDINDFDIYPATVSASNYFGGKGLAKLTNLCLIAKQLAVSDTDFKTCMDKANKAITPYIQNTNLNYFVYDRIWQGIIGNNGLNCTNKDIICSGMDFGASYYNDHHYHYGYLIYAAATYAYLDPSFGVANKVWVENLIRDVGNPSNSDPYFPIFRSFDWYVGHSYSQGIFASGDGKDQESTSEEVNYHYSVMLWGLATNNTRFLNLGNLMFTLNKRSIQRYFLMRSDNSIHPYPIVLDKVSGINFENKVHYITWFGYNTEYIHGIQMIPYTPALELVREYEFVSEEWQLRLKNLNLNNTEAWKSLLYLSYASIDKNAAWDVLKVVAMDDGLTRSWALYSCASRTVYGNKVPSPSVFDPSYLNYVIGSSSDWSFTVMTSYQHKANAGRSALTLKNSMTSANDFYVVSTFTKGSDLSQFGVVMNFMTSYYGKQIVYFKYSNNGILNLCLEYIDLAQKGCQNVGSYTWNVGEQKTMMMRFTITSGKQYYSLYVNNKLITTINIASSWSGGEHGLICENLVMFDNMFISSSTNVKVTLTDCSLSNSTILQSIAQTLGINVAYILGLQRYGCSKKKDIMATETISFNIVGSSYTSSSLYASKLQENPPSNFENVEYSTLSSDTTMDLDLNNVAEFGFEPLIISGASIAVIAVVVAASIAFVGIAIFVVKKKIHPVKKPNFNEDKQDESNKEESLDENETRAKQGINIDILNVSPKEGRMTSITARTQY